MILRRRSLFLVLAAVLAVLLVIAIRMLLVRNDTPGAAGQAAARPASPPSAAQVSPVIVAPAVQVRDDVRIEVVGSALATSSVTLFPAVSGEVAQVAFRAGDQVKAGQLLIQLVNRNEQLALERAEAEAAAAARLLKRYENTRDTGAVPASVVDEARLALRTAELAVAQAREALRDRTVVAPFAGVVGIARVDPGNRVTPTTELTTLDDRSTVSVAFQVPEPFLARLERGQKVELKTVAYPGRSFAGRLSHLDSRVDPASRTVTVRAAVPNPQDLLRPGMSFSVQLMLPGPEVLQVPELAVQWSRDGSHLWVVREQRAQQVPARVVRRLEGAVLVAAELQAGEPIVVEGFHRLRPQRPVRVVQERPAAAPQPAAEAAETTETARSAPATGTADAQKAAR